MVLKTRCGLGNFLRQGLKPQKLEAYKTGAMKFSQNFLKDNEAVTKIKTKAPNKLFSRIFVFSFCKYQSQLSPQGVLPIRY